MPEARNLAPHWTGPGPGCVRGGLADQRVVRLALVAKRSFQPPSDVAHVPPRLRMALTPPPVDQDMRPWFGRFPAKSFGQCSVGVVVFALFPALFEQGNWRVPHGQ